jgi:hypothetical protein
VEPLPRPDRRSRELGRRQEEWGTGLRVAALAVTLLAIVLVIVLLTILL